ncbi:laminin subunit beta-3 isoform X2 [Gouania willdenowi]|nr:laminin subunit beta-3 isoform X2 [Gouania willdenowi]
MRTFLLLTALAVITDAQRDCSRGACYPPSGDLLLGRSDQFTSSSTCGLTGSEVYCTPYEQRKMKCCPCDSTNPKGPLAHTLPEVLSSSPPERWWQSKKEVSPVILQLDLEDLYQLDNIVLHFKGPRPSALVIERTLDNGTTWQPMRYLSTDCEESFTDVPTTRPLSLDRTSCSQLPPTDANPYRDHTIEFSPLRHYAYAPPPKSEKVEEVTGLTGLRVRMEQLGDVPRPPGRALSRFYALKEMRVMGSCMCHGHANRCLPEVPYDPRSNTRQVNPQCDCQHNTDGMNCERCKEFYNDLPWSHAEEDDTHTCRRCECNNHAVRCHFDPDVFEQSGRTSGGVCEGCQHHTTGPKCDQCVPGYQPNPNSRMDRPDACTRCVCDADGSLNGGRCDEVTGSCLCKVNVEGLHCDRCRRGFYGLSASNTLGCTKCSCSPDGSLSDVCDPLTGQCLCRSHFHGLTCDTCSKGYWKPLQSKFCQPCGCDTTKSTSDACDQVTGQCLCRPGFGGRTCNECPDRTFGNPLKGCQPCKCDPEGTLPGVCDKTSGACLCRPGLTGSRCDSCGPGRCDSFPACDSCPSCFFTLQNQIKNQSSALEKLSDKVSARPDPEDFGPRIRDLETSLNLIRNSVSLPPTITKQVDDALSTLKELRDKVDEVNDNLPNLPKIPNQNPEVDRLQALLDKLQPLYKAKKDAADNTVNPDHTGVIKVIKEAYDNSTDAAKKVDASKDKVKESEDTREEATDLIDGVQPDNVKNLERLQNNMDQPDLTPVAKQVCGSVRSKPCTPLLCEGSDLCPPEGSPPCKKGEKCVGALPLGKKADKDAKDVMEQLDRLSKKITDAAEKLQKTQQTTNQVRDSADKLNKKMNQAKNDLEEDVKDTRDIVKDIKDFLSEPSTDPNHIQTVSDWILKAKIPTTTPTLKKKLEELKKLAENLPDSTAVLKEAEPLLETAKKLLKEAQDTRDNAKKGKGEVDKLLQGFGPVEENLSDVENRLQDTMDLIDNLYNNLTKTEDQLRPAEDALDDVTDLLKPVKPQLDQLKTLLEDGKQDAQNADKNAEDAVDESTAAEDDLSELQKQVDKLKDQAPPPTEAGPIGDRIAKLKQNAKDLANNTDDMLKGLEGKADSIRNLQDDILQKSKQLEGLDTKLKDLITQLRKKGRDLSNCQG